MRNATCRSGIWVETVINMENEKSTLYDLDNRENTEIWGKWETHTVGPWIWQKKKKPEKLENDKYTLYDLKCEEGPWKTLKMRNAHSRTWIMGRNPKNMENETQTPYDLEYGEKNWKTWKMKHANCNTWNMAKKKPWKTWIMRNAHCRMWIFARKLRNLENESLTL